MLWQVQIPWPLWPQHLFIRTHLCSLLLLLLPLCIYSLPASRRMCWYGNRYKSGTFPCLGWVSAQGSFFVPTLPSLPSGMMSSVRTISASSCRAMPAKRVYPSTYSSLPPYGAAASPASLSRKLERDVILTQLLIILLAFCRYNFWHYSVIASCNISNFWLLCLHLNYIPKVHTPKSCVIFLHLFFLTLQPSQYLHLCSGTHWRIRQGDGDSSV